jgi:hypothetical protein
MSSDSAAGADRRIYRPRPSAVLEYVWGVAPLALGVAGLSAFHDTALHVVGGTIPFLFGLWAIACTRSVMTTWFVTTGERIVSVRANAQTVLRWEQVVEVVIRQRPSSFPPGRMDRIVMLRGPGGQLAVFNTSVLSPEDEQFFLSELRRRVHCPIETRNDGPDEPQQRNL